MKDESKRPPLTELELEFVTLALSNCEHKFILNEPGDEVALETLLGLERRGLLEWNETEHGNGFQPTQELRSAMVINRLTDEANQRRN